jgi:hypothetical protein
MSDGSRSLQFLLSCHRRPHTLFSLRQSWSKALVDAEAQFRQLLTSPANNWKRIAQATDSSPTKKGKARAPTLPDLTDVTVHRYSNKAGGEDIYRLILDVPTGDEIVSLEPWKAVLTTPELRREWDPAVEEAHLLEMFDHNTRIDKTNFTLGWPAKSVFSPVPSHLSASSHFTVHEMPSPFPVPFMTKRLLLILLLPSPGLRTNQHI